MFNKKLLNFLEGFLTRSNPLEGIVMLSECIKRSKYNGKIRNEAVTKLSHTQKCSKGFHISQLWEVFDSLNLAGIRRYCSIVQKIPKAGQSCLKKFALQRI